MLDCKKRQYILWAESTTGFIADVAERQTRCVQVAVSSRGCRFKSYRRHQFHVWKNLKRCHPSALEDFFVQRNQSFYLCPTGFFISSAALPWHIVSFSARITFPGRPIFPGKQYKKKTGGDPVSRISVCSVFRSEESPLISSWQEYGRIRREPRARLPSWPRRASGGRGPPCRVRER